MENGQEFDIIVIGGGAVGTAIVRDLSLRGTKVLLLEKKDLAEGSTGRSLGILHSGAEVARMSAELAREIAQENQILRKLIPDIIYPLPSYFVSIKPEDDVYLANMATLCQSLSIPLTEIPKETFFKQEPNCSREIQSVFQTETALINPFLLCALNCYDAMEHGAEICTYSEVKHLMITENEVIGVRYHDLKTNQMMNIYSKLVINATNKGIGRLETDLKGSSLQGFEFRMGTNLIVKDPLVSSIIYHASANHMGAYVCPNGSSVLVGSSLTTVEQPGMSFNPERYDDIEQLISMGEELLPDLRKHRLYRYYSGIIPVKQSFLPNSAFCYPYTINDHEKLDQTGYISVIGGDLCLHRLIAEKVSNLACQKIKNSAPCLTKETPLVSSGIQLHAFPNKAMFQDFSAHPLARDYLTHAFCQELIVMCKKCLNSTTNREKSPILCDCEAISEEMLHWAAKNLFVTQIDDYRRRTRQGMGICQGQFCFMKIANFETKISNKTHAKIIEELKHSLEKRWKTERLGDVYLKRQIKLAKYMYILGGNLQ